MSGSLEIFGRYTGNGRLNLQMDLGNGKTIALLLECHFRFGFDVADCEAALPQNHRQSHRKAARVGGGNQFLGIGSAFTLESRFV